MTSILDKILPDSSPETIKTSWGVAVDNTDDSLKVGSRGPTLIQDFHFRDKITHFDHERIPERVVHARGFGAKGYFESLHDISNLTKAKVFEKGEKTPVFVRFSTVLGSKGSADTVRDVRGFATKFYTREGNWDLVGNNIPVFFIQDAIKFPDIIHAGKPEPHNEIPQAQTAHDNFWDLISQLPESTHMIAWILSDRAIPRSYRMMEGFGVHTFIFVNANEERCFVKFHWKPKLGVHSITWDECQKLAGQDPDFHRKDLFEAIEDKMFPEWELGVQIVKEEDEDKFDFDLLDATKLIPEELVPVQIIGRMVLNENVTNYFQDTEQVAFCTQHIVPGIDFSDDPLLQGRNFSYHDTQLTRLGGPNFNQIPVNRPKCNRNLENNQQDGMHRECSFNRTVNYFPNRFGCPAMADPSLAFKSYPAAISGKKVRERSDKFNEHVSQAQSFYNGLTELEKTHLKNAALFELSHVADAQVVKNAINNILMKISVDLGQYVAESLNIAVDEFEKIESVPFNSLSQLRLNNKIESVLTRKVAIIVDKTVHMNRINEVFAKFTLSGTVPLILANYKVDIKDSKGAPKGVTFVTHKSTMFDGAYILAWPENAKDFINEMKSHQKCVGFADVCSVQEYLNGLKKHRTW